MIGTTQVLGQVVVAAAAAARRRRPPRPRRGGGWGEREGGIPLGAGEGGRGLVEDIKQDVILKHRQCIVDWVCWVLEANNANQDENEIKRKRVGSKNWRYCSL